MKFTINDLRLAIVGDDVRSLTSSACGTKVNDTSLAFAELEMAGASACVLECGGPDTAFLNPATSRPPGQETVLSPGASAQFPRPALCAGRGPRRGDLISAPANQLSPATSLKSGASDLLSSPCALRGERTKERGFGLAHIFKHLLSSNQVGREDEQRGRLLPINDHSELVRPPGQETVLSPGASEQFPRPALCAGRGSRRGDLISSPTRHLSLSASRAFTLVEIMVAMGILSLIVLALMTVFTNTQTAFRSSVTSSDIMENGRATMELMTADLRGMAPSGGYSLGTNNALAANGMAFPDDPVNFFVTNNPPTYYQPMMQPLIGSANGAMRMNMLQYFFILGRQNTMWTGVGYFVNTLTPPNISLYPLYRFSAQTNIENSPATLFNLFQSAVYADQANNTWTNMSHLMDGVVGLTVQTYDLNGVLLTNGFGPSRTNYLQNTWFTPPYQGPGGMGGAVGCAFFSNALPASVEIELDTLEDRSMQRAESLGTPTMTYGLGMGPEWAYLTNRANAVHIFRQRVVIPQVDPSAYNEN